MHFFGSGFAQIRYIVAQLGAAHYGVVAEHHLVAFDQRGVGYQFHLGHQLAPALCAGGEAAGPCRCIFDHAAQIWFSDGRGIAESHASSGVRHWTYEIYFFGILLVSCIQPDLITYFIDIAALVRTWGITVVNPHERTDLHLVARGFELSDAVA